MVLQNRDAGARNYLREILGEGFFWHYQEERMFLLNPYNPAPIKWWFLFGIFSLFLFLKIKSMHPKLCKPVVLLLFSFLAVTSRAIAQQAVQNIPKEQYPKSGPIDPSRPNYIYTILTGNKGLYGYDILKDGVLVMHQPAEAASDKTLSLKTSIQATRAAMFVIFKMKNNIQPVTLSADELKKVTIN